MKKNIMNNYAILLFILSSFCGFSQDFDRVLEEVKLSEAKSALRQMSFEANLNTSNYDIVYNRLELSVDPSVAFISGNITAYYRAKESMEKVTFDLADNLNVSSVLQRGNPLNFSQNSNDELVIDLSTTLNTDVLDSLTISYSGNPISSGFGSFEQNNHNGDEIIWTLSEPYGAKGWWPCKQDLIDKIDSIDVFLTTPRFNSNSKENIAVSNGLEQSQIITGVNKTTHFKHRYAIPAYLVAIAVTNYSVYNHNVENNGKPFDIVNYVYPENLTEAQSSTPVTVDIMNLFTELFEEYPFAKEKYGHAQFGWGGGMEHTTVSFMGGFNRNLIAHELAHQWFGNKITCGSWQDIWLNEGFATYLSGLAIEDLDGEIAFNTWKQQRIASITSAPNGSVYLKPQDTLIIGRIFNGRLSYNKGAMVLHMLRKKLGNNVFFNGMKQYLNDPDFAYDYAVTEDFKSKMESASGIDLAEFFDDWVYEEGYPSYLLSWTQNSEMISFTINQSQSDASVAFFESDLTLRLLGSAGETRDITVANLENNQRFTESVSFNVDQIIIDPDFDLISNNNSAQLLIEDNFEEDFRLFPNPIDDKLYLRKPADSNISEITVYSTLGQILYNSGYRDEVDFSQFHTGLYSIRLKTSKGTIIKSLLKK